MASLGPGLVTGVADDDPSGISTYTIAGAAHGYQFLWMSLLTLPLNAAVQLICARVGIMKGEGLARVIAERHGRRLLVPAVALLLIANTVNLGADIGAIGAAVELLTDVPAHFVIVPVGVGLATAEVLLPYGRLAAVFKLLTLTVFAYVAGAFFASPDWGAVLSSTFVPRLSLRGDEIATIVAILGTTISPYLFFWQASEEVEEELRPPGEAPGIRRARLLRDSRLDVILGMGLANVGFFFVVLTAAAALNGAGVTKVETAAQAAEALRPLAGNGATILFALGIIGTGVLAVPVLAGASGYPRSSAGTRASATRFARLPASTRSSLSRPSWAWR